MPGMKALVQILPVVMMCVGLGIAQTSTPPSLLIQDGHLANTIVFSRDAKLMATAGDDATVRIWDADKGVLLRILYGHTSSVRSIAFSSDNAVLASGSFDRTVKLWDVASGNLVRTLEGHAKGVDCVDIHSIYRRVVSSGSDGLRIWDTQSGRETLKIPAHTYGANYVRFALSDRKLLVVSRGLDDSTSGQYRTKIWDAERGNLVRTFQNTPAIAVSGDGQVLAVATGDRLVQLFELQTFKTLRTLRPTTDDSADIVSLSLDGSGNRLALLNQGSQFVEFWDVTSGRLIKRIGGDESSTPNNISLNFNGKVLATDGNGLELWDLDSGRMLHRIEQHTSDIRSLSFDPTGSMIAVGYSNDSRLNLWDVKTGRRTRLLERHRSYVTSISFSPDGKQIASGGYDETFKLIDADTAQLIRQFGRHAGWTRTVVFSPDGKTLASGSDDRLIKLWDVASGRLLHTLAGHNGIVFQVTFSPDGMTLASGGQNREINMWDVRSGSLRTTLDTSVSTDTGMSSSVNSLSFSRDGKFLLSANQADEVKLWEVRTGNLVRTFEGDEAALSPNSQLIATVSDGVMKTWDLRTGRFVRSFTSPRPVISLPAFSPNSRLLIASNGESVAVWSVATGALLMNLLSLHYGGVDEWITYAPDGFYTGSQNSDKYVSWTIDRGFGLPEIHTAAEYSTQFAKPALIASRLSSVLEEKQVKPAPPRSRRANRRP